MHFNLSCDSWVGKICLNLEGEEVHFDFSCDLWVYLVLEKQNAGVYRECSSILTNKMMREIWKKQCTSIVAVICEVGFVQKLRHHWKTKSTKQTTAMTIMQWCDGGRGRKSKARGNTFCVFQ